jgi:hypothetical protein
MPVIVPSPVVYAYLRLPRLVMLTPTILLRSDKNQAGLYLVPSSSLISVKTRDQPVSGMIVGLNASPGYNGLTLHSGNSPWMNLNSVS